jgi:alkylhydroperoxidase family enzyme
MAFIAFEHGPAFLAPVSVPAAPPPARFSPLEWLVVALARRERPASLKRPGRIAQALQGLFGRSVPAALADDKLEALRRMAVLSWRHGPAVPAREVDAFLAAGFSRQHYQAMLDSIGVAHGSAQA